MLNQNLIKTRGITLVELVIASALVSVVGIAIAVTGIFTERMFRSINYQQISLRNAKSAIETLNIELRYATTPLRIEDSSGNPAIQGNRVEFTRSGETTVRAFELVSDDAFTSTPWDNRLVYDPDIDTSGDEEIIAVDLIPFETTGSFRYTGASAPLIVQMRVGDPAVTQAQDAQLFEQANMRSGPGLQGMEINITVAPRN